MPQAELKRINQEAIAWFTRMNGEPSPADRRNFENWHQASPAHASAYQEVVTTWSSADMPGAEVAAEEADQLNQYLLAVQAVRVRRNRRNVLAGTAASLFVLFAGFHIWLDHPHFLQDLSADYVTARAERRTILLSDGSQVTLDADSALAFKTSDGLRHAQLLRGMAYFDVKSSSTPFEVEAADGKTRVTGTAFSVEVHEQDVVVNLERGAVTVSSASQDQQAHLTPGQSVNYNKNGVGSVQSVLIDDALAWREGRLIFDNFRLQDVIEQIGRYHNGRIVMIGSSLAEYRVSGNLPIDDTKAALASLQATVGFKIYELGSRLMVIR
ncbi:FecR family protein [Paenochrobactrum sp. BZR 588]|uniref:FecR family protein n=1 Tax=unclassified Paenochrobactrum TaxID=2639760 RepID=UPI0038552799